MKNTFCIFKEVEIEVLKDKKFDYISKTGSKYCYTKNGVYRLSDHWERTANSKWRLLPLDNQVKKIRLGYANFTDFHKDNLFDKLYYVEVDYQEKKVFFNHKNNQQNSNKAVLRTSSETTKVIRQIRNLLENHQWKKHYKNQNIAFDIIEQLINSNESLANIKFYFLKNDNFKTEFSSLEIEAV